MNFDFSDDQKLLRKTARTFLAQHAPLSLCRAVLESDASCSDSLWKSVGELGWLGTVIPEAYGGSGFGHLELAVTAEEIGRALAPIPFCSSVYLATEAILLTGSLQQKQAYLPKLAAGEWVGTFAHDERPGASGTKGIATTFTRGKLTGTKVPVADGDVAHFAVVTAKSGKGVVLVLVDLAGGGVERNTVRSLDPSRSLAALRFDAAPAQLLGEAGNGWKLTQQLFDRAAVLMAFEQLGGAERAFEITHEYCLSRYAFGRPIASFQALKHRLADLYVEIELARSNAYYGAWALSNQSDELPAAACGARASATDAFELASREMIQLHGGVGYTWEYDCHLFYRRAKWLSAVLGSADRWRERLIERLETPQTKA
ncbi:MAG TPA: acyl-CoA dehydrogenase family protein [Candidatus Acidoferrales bacterium]|nr:acyl-CoA dehydrogenase family protein [Candidatus Acidoferrales bacterium]